MTRSKLSSFTNPSKYDIDDQEKKLAEHVQDANEYGKKIRAMCAGRRILEDRSNRDNYELLNTYRL